MADVLAGLAAEDHELDPKLLERDEAVRSEATLVLKRILAVAKLRGLPDRKPALAKAPAEHRQTMTMWLQTLLEATAHVCRKVGQRLRCAACFAYSPARARAKAAWLAADCPGWSDEPNRPQQPSSPHPHMR